MTENQRKYLGAVIRAALLILAGHLTRGHALPAGLESLLGPAVNDLSEQILAGLIAAVAVLWSVLQKRLQGIREEVALALPSSAEFTREDITEVVRTTNPGLSKVPLA